jgi:hypothetical protein
VPTQQRQAPAEQATGSPWTEQQLAEAAEWQARRTAQENARQGRLQTRLSNNGT